MLVQPDSRPILQSHSFTRTQDLEANQDGEVKLAGLRRPDPRRILVAIL
jgi:hypothetical protein